MNFSLFLLLVFCLVTVILCTHTTHNTHNNAHFFFFCKKQSHQKKAIRGVAENRTSPSIASVKS